MLRHALMFAMLIVGVSAVGSNLAKRQLAVEFDGDIQQAMAKCDQLGQQMDAEFQRTWDDQHLHTAELADNLLVVRRLGLALTGTPPSLQEIRAVQSIESEKQIDWWLQHVFQDRRHADYLAERFARAFVGTEEGPFLIFRRRRFVSWLSDQLMENRPYDEIVRSLLSDDGPWTDKPAVNFVTVTTASTEDEQPDAERLAARTARAFLGVRLDCMQCHDDNLGGDWLQSDFQQLAAYFAEAQSFGLGLGIQDTPREYEYKYLHADEEVVVPPTVPFASDLFDESEEGTRRQQLAAWVTHPENQAFSRATVNRVWAFMFGRPLVEPVDDIPLEGPYPPGFELLAKDFSQHRDLRRLITAIAKTRVFRQQSRVKDGAVTPELEENWAVFPLVRLRPEQVARSIIQASNLKTIDARSHILVQLAKFGQIDEFVKRYGDRGEDEFVDQGGTIPQRMVMLNGNLVYERTQDNLISNAATRVARQVKSNQRAIELAYLIVLTRPPSKAEKEHFLKVMENDKLNRNQKLEDVFWRY